VTHDLYFLMIDAGTKFGNSTQFIFLFPYGQTCLFVLENLPTEKI